MSLEYLNEALAAGDNEKLIRCVRLHLGDGNEAAGRKEIDKARVAIPVCATARWRAVRRFGTQSLPPDPNPE